MQVYGQTNLGKIRNINEDSFFIQRRGPCYFVVADGMGGHNAGEVASATLIESVNHFIKSNYAPIKTEEEARALTAGALRYANSIVHTHAAADEALGGMGSTCVLCLLENQKAYIVNVGDSRLYMTDENRQTLQKVTVDHSVVEQLVRNGTITADQARNHPQKNMITRAIGSEETVDVDFFTKDFKPGQVILMCSDGLSGMVTDEEMLEVIKREQNAKDIVKKLIDAANALGGADNITAICITQ